MTEVDRLTGAEGGQWRIWTQGSSHILDLHLDLDQMTVTRVPGAGRPPSINDTTRPLRTVGACRVGERGAWTMHSDGRSDTVDFYWHYTSEIRNIERLTGAEQSDAAS